MKLAYNLGVMSALEKVGIAKIANPELAQMIAGGAQPEELQGLADSKITEKDIESAAKVVQVIAEMKQMADNAGMTPPEKSQGGESSSAVS